MARDPTLPEVLNALRAGVFRDLRVAIPGKVEAFDKTTGLADVQPLVSESVEGLDGTISQVKLPVCTGVPVMFPGGGGLRITFPMAAGDFVWLMFGDRSIDAWLSQGQDAAPADERRHSLSDAVAYPGIRPSNAPWQNIEDDVITLGKDSAAASDYIAKATATKSEISAVRDSLNALVGKYNGLQSDVSSVFTLIQAHVHATLGTVAPTLATIGSQAGSGASGPAAVGEIKSETVKVRG